MAEVKCGDVVKMKSGGPKMTVSNFCKNEGWLCQWFNEDRDLQYGSFQADQLEFVIEVVEATKV